MKEISIEICADGSVTVGVTGMSGPECIQLTAEIEKALGEVTKREKTAEFTRSVPVLRKVGV